MSEHKHVFRLVSYGIKYTPNPDGSGTKTSLVQCDRCLLVMEQIDYIPKQRYA